jgi:MFS transporter, MHS family, proline/betaine transporter
VGGAVAFLFESADRRRGWVASWLQASTALSNILGALVAFTVFAAFGADQIKSWAWRIPFVLGLSIVPAGLFLRRTLRETGEFLAVSERRCAGELPARAALSELFRWHGRSLVVGFCIAALWAVPVYVLIIFLPTYVQRPDTYGFSASQAFAASLVGNIPLVLGCMVFGHLSDRLGRRTMLALSAILLILCVAPLFLWLRAYPTAATLMLVQSAIGILVASIGGVAPAALAELFPTGVRSTGTAVVYNGAFTLLGGFAPAILTWLQRSGGSAFAPAWYVMLTAAIALLAIPFHRPLSAERWAATGRFVSSRSSC